MGVRPAMMLRAHCLKLGSLGREPTSKKAPLRHPIGHGFALFLGQMAGQGLM
jgi:hypothetical protein